MDGAGTGPGQPSPAGRARPVRLLHHDTADRPFIVIWEVTRACALACRHCRADAIPRRDPRELGTDEGRRLLEELASFGAPRPLVVLTGGDPFERPDLAELVRYGTSLGLSVSLSPSVTPRLTRDVLDELRDAGAKAVSVSLDGAEAATHDAFRGVPGVFDDTLAALDAVRDAGLRLQVNTTVTADNVHELPFVLRRVLDARVSLWSVFFLVPTGRGQALDALTAHDEEDVLHWLHEVSDLVPVKATEAAHHRRVAVQRAATDDPDAVFPPGPLRVRLRRATALALAGGEFPRRPPRPPMDVGSGRGFAFVDHVGDVYPSGFLPVVAGSVRDVPFPEVYRTSPVLRSLRDPAALGGRCGRCEFAAVCGGSRSQAYARTGDLLGDDPSCTFEPSRRR
ncbi:radical SAM protein [Cellulomonas chitinilytica]|uniref:Radical SAM protein n=1 Tax=Cellulomonas chitinilytica TaxID=398759 RepID=A0A919NX85_9CELL|nr:TIGR04053 family radical SAM/SPASM domain-containing protein [Cellulomonas chitinilytica]GIG19278.1 radical SAM protein [Cellulomonas chitinilytica]